MHPKLIMRVGLKVAGVWLGVSAITQLSPVVFTLIQVGAFGGGGGGFGGVATLVFMLASPAVSMGAGLVLMFRSEWLVRLLMPTPDGACVECGYRLIGGDPLDIRAPRTHCPECGTPIPGGGLTSDS